MTTPDEGVQTLLLYVVGKKSDVHVIINIAAVLLSSVIAQMQ